jgi:hypothetical protein
MGTDKIGIGDEMRPLSSLLSRQTLAPRPAVSDSNAKAQDAADAAKPRPKRCLNEAGHKLYR